ncbi:cytochrome c [Thiobacillus denitrificans]|uniref:cytochrome c n=1 Tax=Thiobacillus denitrificans TaxID=36861 RepID=UPI0012FBFCE5|nr:cytochrome c [Thiobacillus denitrificans]
MLNNSFHWAASLVSAVLLSMAMAGVSHAEPSASVQDDPGHFARGAQAWANNCASCHNLRPAKDLRDDQWRVVVAHMRVRADLTGQEARDVLKFLQESN